MTEWRLRDPFDLITLTPHPRLNERDDEKESAHVDPNQANDLKLNHMGSGSGKSATIRL